MKPHINLNEVQRLAGRIAALSRFISRATEHDLPFFKALRTTRNFAWDEACQQAFQDLKTYLAKLRLLAKLTLVLPTNQDDYQGPSTSYIRKGSNDRGRGWRKIVVICIWVLHPCSQWSWSSAHQSGGDKL
ncbi:UNVERIFIED_CONTAM: hypothetical protein Sangu_0197300 [Sesamum angustifolium]|uniref:Uncharacterized protein n=1 Tax=Sesamum angustifolium TaxID=2727405 RepID=A0AAW2RMG8_9LAMI